MVSPPSRTRRSRCRSSPLVVNGSVGASGSRLLRMQAQITCTSCLSFAPCSALRKGLHTTSMRPFPHLEHETKSGAIRTSYLCPPPKTVRRAHPTTRAFLDALVFLVPKLQLGNPVLEAPASRFHRRGGHHEAMKVSHRFSAPSLRQAVRNAR